MMSSLQYLIYYESVEKNTMDNKKEINKIKKQKR